MLDTLTISIFIPFVSFAATCLIFWGLKVVRKGIISALALSDLETVFIFFFVFNTSERIGLFAFATYSILLLILGIIIILKPKSANRIGDKWGFSVFVLANIVAGFWLSFYLLGLDIAALGILVACLAGVVFSLKHGAKIISLAKALRRRSRELAEIK